ncbi:MAG: histidine kinase [Rhodospirillales bacterium]
MDATTDAEHLTELATPPHNDRVGVLSILWVWVFYFVLNTVRMAISGADHQIAMAGRRIVVVLVGVVLTAGLYLVLRRVDRAAMPVRLAVALTASVPVAFAHAAFNYYAFYVYAPIAFFPEEAAYAMDMHKALMMELVSTAADWYFFIIAWASLYIAFSNAAQAHYAEDQAARYRAQAQSAQLRALRYQLNPHFLFNTLNSLSTLVMRRNPEQAEQMIGTLAAFLRSTLTTDPTEDATLADEIRTQRLYLDIEAGAISRPAARYLRYSGIGAGRTYSQPAAAAAGGERDQIRRGANDAAGDDRDQRQGGGGQAAYPGQRRRCGGGTLHRRARGRVAQRVRAPADAFSVPRPAARPARARRAVFASICTCRCSFSLSGPHDRTGYAAHVDRG